MYPPSSSQEINTKKKSSQPFNWIADGLKKDRMVRGGNREDSPAPPDQSKQRHSIGQPFDWLADGFMLEQEQAAIRGGGGDSPVNLLINLCQYHPCRQPCVWLADG